MHKNDSKLISEAYDQIYSEGIWDRLKGIGSGIKMGVGTGLKNLGGKIVGDPQFQNTQTMGQAYAKAQQSSLFKSFVTKAEKELNDFLNDLKKMGVDADINSIRQTHPPPSGVDCVFEKSDCSTESKWCEE